MGPSQDQLDGACRRVAHRHAAPAPVHERVLMVMGDPGTFMASCGCYTSGRVLTGALAVSEIQSVAAISAGEIFLS